MSLVTGRESGREINVERSAGSDGPSRLVARLHTFVLSRLVMDGPSPSWESFTLDSGSAGV